MANALANLFTDIADSIRSKTGSTEKLSPSEFASQIDSISVGGGGAEGCVTVTFMNGANVLLTRPVYIGDDCPDPVTQGRIETPTKESTVQYHYTYKGWSEALTNITEDKVIYATYTETVRTYTVTFYDEDGVTLLHTEQVEYGSVPSYIPVRAGYIFNNWIPEATACVGDMSYTASWTETVDFAVSSWASIASASREGKAQNSMAVGDTRLETINFGGKSYNVTLKIAGFNHDTLADGSGKAGMTIVCHTGGVTGKWNKSNTYLETGIATSLLTLYNEGIAEELKNVIAQVTKTCNYANGSYAGKYFTADMYIFALAYKECGWEQISTYHNSKSLNTGTCYELYQSAYLGSANMPFAYTTTQALSRDAYSSYSANSYCGISINSLDKKIYTTESTFDIIWGFCI